MAGAQTTETDGANGADGAGEGTAPAEGTPKGHPRGLYYLFFTEMWERFSYYGMRAFLVFYVAASVDKGGLGQSEEVAFIVYGMYGSLVYLMSLPGGWIADRFLGQQKAVLFCIRFIGNGGFIFSAVCSPPRV